MIITNKLLKSLDISNNKVNDIGPLRNMPNLPLTSIMLGGNPLPDYVFKDALKEQVILSLISSYVDKAVEDYYGSSREYGYEGISDIEKVGGEYRLKIRLETFTGAHNPPYGLDTMTVIIDFNGIRVENFKHEELN